MKPAVAGVIVCVAITSPSHMNCNSVPCRLSYEPEIGRSKVVWSQTGSGTVTVLTFKSCAEGIVYVYSVGGLQFSAFSTARRNLPVASAVLTMKSCVKLLAVMV